MPSPDASLSYFRRIRYYFPIFAFRLFVISATRRARLLFPPLPAFMAPITAAVMRAAFVTLMLPMPLTPLLSRWLILLQIGLLSSKLFFRYLFFSSFF